LFCARWFPVKPEDSTTKHTKHTKKRSLAAPARSKLGPLVSLVCLVVKLPYVPACAGISGEKKVLIQPKRITL
jgi:hypothetical protein